MIPSVDAVSSTLSSPSTPESSRWLRLRALAPPIAVVVVGLAVSAPTIGFDFVLYDDDYLVYRNPVIQDLGNAALFFDPLADRTWMGSEYLPITTLSFAVDHALYRGSPHGFHATNVLLYTLICWLLYLVLGRFTSDRWTAAVGAILFAVHPVHTENFAWVAGRKSLLNGVFTLLSFLAYMRFRDRKQRGWYAAALASYVLAFFSKYTAVSLPGALLVYDLIFIFRRPGSSRDSPTLLARVGKSAIAVAPFLVVGACLSALAVKIGIRHEIVTPRSGALSSAALNDPIILLRYLKLLVLPVDQCAYYLWPRRETLTLPAVVGYSMLAALLAAAWSVRGRAALLSFGTAWFVVLLVPVLNVFPKVPELAERYLFQSSIALSFAAVWMWDRARGRDSESHLSGRAARIGLVAVLATFAVMSHTRSRIWSDSYTLWNRTLEHPMASPAAYDQLGLAHLTLGRDPEAAIEVFQRGLRDLRRRGGGPSRLGAEMRFHLVLGYLEAGDRARARDVWRELEAVCAASDSTSVRSLVEGWRRDLARHSPELGP